MSKINHYDVLGVPRDCEQSLIETVYKSMVKIFHPDVFKGDKAFAQEKLKVINEAYGVLGNAERRKSYDADLKRSESSGATEEIYEDESPDHQPFDDMYTDEWKVVIGYFPDIDDMYKSLRRLNLSLSAAFQIVLISNKDYRGAQKLFKKLQQEFLRTKFGENFGIHSLVLQAIETGNKRFALELNRDLLILGEQEYPIILERLGKKYKDFSSEYYPKCGFSGIENFRKCFGLKPGRYRTWSNQVFGILPNYSAYIELPNFWGAKSFESMEELVKAGFLSAEAIRTADKIG